MRRYACRGAALAVAALMGWTMTTMAQTERKPTLEELIPGGADYHRVESRSYMWAGDDICLEREAGCLKGMRLNGHMQVAEQFTALTLDEANLLLKRQGLNPMKSLLRAEVTADPADEGRLLLLLDTGRERVLVGGPQKGEPWAEGEVVWSQPHPQGAAHEEWNERSRHLAYTRNNNLWVLTAEGREVQLTDEPTGVVCGQSVHRNEFGISKGTFWSPDGERLAYYRMDERMVTTYPLVDITARIGKLNEVRYPMAGMTSHQVMVGIYDVRSGRNVWLQTGDPTDRYFTNLAWAPDGESLYLMELNRDQNHAVLCRYSAADGRLMQRLYEEERPTYVEPQQPICFVPWDKEQFILQSERDGWNHLYLYDTQGRLIRQLTSGPWMVQQIVGFDQRTRSVIVTTTEVSPLQSNISAVRLKDGRRWRIGSDEGIHRARLSGGKGTRLLDEASAPELPRRVSIRSTALGEGGKECVLMTASDPYEGLEMPVIETGTLKAADGVTDLHYRLVKPARMEQGKKYPAIIYVYGGPHAQLVTNGFMHGVRGWDLYMASKGYVLFTLDNRGSSNRGKAFEECTFRHLGVEECKDQVKGVEWLKSLPYVDGDRIGVHGWSFGGHMTTALMLRYPDLFKVGVAGGPVIDWRYYEVMYGERYMDTPQTNPDGYRECDLKNLAGQLKGRLLLIHDDHDDTCVPQHTLSFIKACVDARTYPDLFIYPTHKHNVAGRDRVHLHEKITSYFEEHL